MASPDEAAPGEVLVAPSFTFGDLRVEGFSRAGDQTWLRVRPPGIAFDVGRGIPRLAGAPHLFISHGHLDHCLGVPYVLSERTLHQSASTRVYCPAPMESAMRRFIDAAAALEKVRYDYRLRGMEPGERVEIGRDHVIEAFATAHVVPSLGFHLFFRKRRLLPELVGKTPEELGALRRRGAVLERTVEELRLSYCGDTTAEVLDLEPRLLETPILMMECTFLGGATREKGTRFGHTHLEALAARAGDLGNEAVVLYHLSRRFSYRELARRAAEALAAARPRILVLGEDG